MKEYKQNIFTDIINNKIPINKVFEDDICLAFHDIKPRAPVHVLVITKKLFVDFNHFIKEGDSFYIAKFFQNANTIATINLKLCNFQILTNNGAGAGQEIFHFHVHIKGY